MATDDQDNMVKYIITAKTSSEFEEGSTDATVSIKLLKGEAECQTKWIVLDNFWRDDFERGRTDVFNIKCQDVGTPIIIGLKITGNPSDDGGWKCDTVKVQKAGSEEVEFLVYNWLKDELWILRGQASLPQEPTFSFAEGIRQREIEENKIIYQWHNMPTPADVGWDLPRFVDAENKLQLPKMFCNIDEQDMEFGTIKGTIQMNTLFQYGKSKLLGSGIHSLDDYHDLYQHSSLPYTKPQYINCWKEDTEMGRQMLSGVNPTTLERCYKIPEGFYVTNEMVANLLDDGKTLEEEIKNGKIYFADYREYTRDIERNVSTKTSDDMYCPNSVAIFYVTKKGDLTPLAIQFTDHDEVFTPNDDEYDWLLAKMYFRTNDMNIHEWKYHFCRTHAIMEPIAVALFRNMSSQHPLYKLLRQHLRTVSAINTLGRTNLLVSSSAANQCLALNAISVTLKAYKELKFDDLKLKDILKKQGTDDPKFLPNFHYREDAYELWDAIERYARNTIEIFYHNNEDIQNDTELQAWIYDMAMEGIGWQNGDTKGFPKELKSIDELVEFVTIVIFTCSVQHAASNFGQFDLYRYIPNTPGCMRLPVHKKGEGSMERILKSLPAEVMSVLQIGTGFLLSSYGPQDVFLGNLTCQLFVNEKAIAAQKSFKDELDKISKRIKARNETLEMPYTFLLPEKIPISIAV